MRHVRDRLNQVARSCVLIASPVLKPLIMWGNRRQATKDWVVVLGGRTHSRELSQQLWEQGYKVFLFDSAPSSMNWRFASGSQVLDAYDIGSIPQIVRKAREMGCVSVLMETDDTLLPINAEVNRQLGSPATFSQTAIRATNDKNVMRECLEKAGMDLPFWQKVDLGSDLSDLPYPCLFKPLEGQGSRGVAYVTDPEEAADAEAFIRDEMGQSAFLIEEYLPGDQYNVDGVILNGEPYFYLITEEEFSDFRPVFKTCWYLFGITLPAKTQQEVVREARAAIAAADFRSGAFHLELRFKGNKAYTFDMANRMAADCPGYARLVHDASLIADYLDVMHGRPVRQGDLAVRCSHLRFYNYPERPAHRQIDTLAQAKADAGLVKLSRNGIWLEMTAAHEAVLRDFLDEAYAFRDHD